MVSPTLTESSLCLLAESVRKWNGCVPVLLTCQPPARAGETPLGAVHTSEIVYFKNTLDMVDRPWTPKDRKLSNVMSSYLVNFAATGNPNGTGLPNWPAYRAGEVMALGDNIGPIPTPDARELAWFDEYVAKQSARR
jgi:carboxylesterase type B